MAPTCKEEKGRRLAVSTREKKGEVPNGPDQRERKGEISKARRDASKVIWTPGKAAEDMRLPMEATKAKKAMRMLRGPGRDERTPRGPEKNMRTPAAAIEDMRSPRGPAKTMRKPRRPEQDQKMPAMTAEDIRLLREATKAMRTPRRAGGGQEDARRGRKR
eukprot:CAMPEP_0194347906 /NCGR_PEP_ID=MMETSP0171-20130528/106245_1 /TAXON_ID=218684 /ORGANISM="Corethron pennatum, Strain L29A3" /LENGTH=160 /DNA_ID=CAMNT_0039115201 /DNA_START=660 /DNA_END=1142 /DNA_ORIENTATION=+